MNVPGVKVDLPALTQKDIDDITEGIKRGFDYIEEMINTMQFLQRCAAQAGYYYNLQAPGSEFGTMKLQTAENDDPIVAQVKIWDNKEHKIRTRFSLRRLVTEEDGSLSVKLPWKL